MASSQNQSDRIIYETGLVRIGAFRCHPAHPSFEDSGPAGNYCFVFPRTAVKIQHEHEPAFVANPNIVTFYNSGQSYLRSAISPKGDHCDWFGVDAQIVRDVVRAFDPQVDEHPERPFSLTRGCTDARIYLSQRNLFASVAAGEIVEPLAVEESVIDLLDRVVRATHGCRRLAHSPEVSLGQRSTIHDIETILSRRPEERVTLKGIAREVGLSPYHVCRLFSRVTGKKLHQYRMGLRLRAALTEVIDSRRPLTDIALDAGFSSHSHFTDSFRHEFGVTPSVVRGIGPTDRAIFR